MRAQRTGLLGGTFDPVHCGHLALAEIARRSLGLDRVLFVPAQAPPHRPAPAASALHRFAMLALALHEREHCLVSDLELRQPAPSYTVTTLRRLRAAGLEAQQLFFITGADAFAEVASWREYSAVLDLAHFVVVSRPGLCAEELRRRLPDLEGRMRTVEAVAASGSHAPTPPLGGAEPTIVLVDAPTPAVSATQIRERRGRGESIVGLTPAAVETFIRHHVLYDPRVSVPELHDRG